MTERIDPERARDDFLPREIDGFVDLIERTPLDAAVPSCPGWAAGDLVEHVGNVHRWVIQAMTTGDASDPAPAVVPDGSLAPWYRGVADDMLELFATRTADSPCWTFGMPPRTAAFWFRRQAHEVAMHRWDLGSASGVDVGYDPELAADGIDEVATIFFPRQVRLGRIAPRAASLAVVDDAGKRWVFAGDGTAAPTDVDATVTGPPDALLLLIWGRVTLDDPRIALAGPHGAAESVLQAGLVP